MQLEKLPKRIRPRANEIVISANLVEVDKNDKVIDKDEQKLYFDEFQTVLRVGSVIRDLKIGDVISVNPKRFAIYQEQKSKIRAAVEGYEKVLVGYDFPIIATGFGDVMLITDADVKYIVEDGFTTDTPCACGCDCTMTDGDAPADLAEENCNTFSPYVAHPEDFKEDFPSETI